jgi:methylase of polypeptide subunit release factors
MAQSMRRSLPLRSGTPEEFAEVRSAFQSARFDEETLLTTLKMNDMSDVGAVDWRNVDFSNVPEQFELFAHLFLSLRSLPRSEVERVLTPATFATFVSLGLFDELENGDCYASVLLYPVGGFWIASDRFLHPDGTKFMAGSDTVFPGIYQGTLQFLRLVPVSPAEEALDLCAGTGIGAFVLSRRNKRAVSSDITERATHFAQFNRDLNNLTNVDVVSGDLYGPVEGQTFDRIVAHPPYVPSLTDATLWRDGGTTGERLVKRIVEGIPQYLRPGGILCLTSLGVDTKEGKFEERARGWLKERADEFDIIFAFTVERTPKEILRDLSEREEGLKPDERQKLQDTFDEAGIISMPKGALAIRRHGPTDRHEAFTLRTRLSEVTDGGDFERTFAARPRFLDSNVVNTLAKSRPALAPRLEVKATHVVYEGELVPAKFIFETDKPFSFSVRVDGWMVPLLARFDGKLTPVEIYEKARANEEMPEGFGINDFNTLVARMIERGLLILPGAAAGSAPPSEE